MWLYLLTTGLTRTVLSDETYRAFGMYDAYSAVVNITYKDPQTNEMRTEKEETGRYGKSSRLDSEWGQVVHVRDSDKNTHGCKKPINAPKGKVRWIALIQRGTCKIQQKIRNVVLKNASAAVIYETKNDTSPLELSIDYDGRFEELSL